MRIIKLPLRQVNNKVVKMKKQTIKGLTLLLVIILFVPIVGFAQDSDDTKKEFKPTVVISQNIIPLTMMGRYLEITNEYWAPGFDKLVDEGKLINWGYITHAWGDEWNVVVHYVAKDFATFQNAWNEGLKSFTESAPEEVGDELIGMISAHKDGIYTGQHYYDGQ